MRLDRFIKMELKLSLLIGLGIFCAQSYSQEDDFDPLEALYGDEETVNIATGSSKPLHLAPSVASVITAEDIKAMGANDLDDVLQSVPGLHVSIGQRYSSVYSVRGIHSASNPHILVLLNGYPLTESFSGGRLPRFMMPINNISRVEIIRGPGSAVYGADAFSGVINIITFDANEQNDTKLGATVGSFNTYGLWLQTGIEIRGWDIAYSLELEKSDGDPNRDVSYDLQSALDAVFLTSASLAPGNSRNQYDLLNSQLNFQHTNWNIRINNWRQDDAGFGVGIADALDDKGKQESEFHLFEVIYSNDEVLNNWNLEAKVNYLYSKQHSFYQIFPPGAVLPIGSDGNLDFTSPNFVLFPDGLIGNPGGKDRSLASEFSALYTGVEGHQTRLSVGYNTTEIELFETKNFGPGVIDGTQPVVDGTLTDVTNTTFIFSPDRKRDIAFASLQHEWSFFNDWELTTGVRLDDYSDFGNTVNPRLALVWQTTYNLTSKLLFGKAFRAPSISELFAINNPVILGNENLDPEEIKTMELSFDYRPSYDLKLRTNLFAYEITGLIDFVPDSGSATSSAQNAKDQDGHGVEFEFNWKVNPALDLNGSYSWQDSEDANSKQEIADAPRQLAYLDMRWGLNSIWKISSQIQYVGDRPRAAGDMREEIDDYSLVNFSIYTEDLTSNMDLRLNFHNVFDKEAFEPGSASVPIDHMLQGRSILLNMEFRLFE